MVDVLLPHFGVGRDEALMRREAAQADAVDKRTLFEPLQVGRLFALHLHLQNFDAVEPHRRRFGRCSVRWGACSRL